VELQLLRQLLNLPTTYAQYNTTGLYNVTLFTIANGCLKSKTKQVRVINPVVRFDVIPDSVCSKPFTLKLVVQDSMLLDSVKWSFAKKDSIVISKKYSDNVTAAIGFDTIAWSANESVCVRVIYSLWLYVEVLPTCLLSVYCAFRTHCHTRMCTAHYKGD
jgi:hypothetical protein